MCFCVVCVWFCTHECRCPRGQKRVSGPLELEVQAAENCLMWMPENKHWNPNTVPVTSKMPSGQSLVIR